MKARALLLFILLPSLGAAAQGYKVIHPDGTIEFTDKPERSAEEINLPNAQGYQSSVKLPNTSAPSVPAAPVPLSAPITTDQPVGANPPNSPGMLLDGTPR